MQETVAGFLFQNHFLFAQSVDKRVLTPGTDGEFFIKRSVVFVSATSKFLYKSFVAPVGRLLLPHPAQCFRMFGIPATAFVLGEDIPEPVELAMLGEQVHTA